jgi:phosphoglycolate phosphatase-like HAD superfamily hydrolase
MKRLILFDIDGTLTRTQNGFVPFNIAILKTFGIDGDIRTVLPDGNTDPKIVEEIFAKKNIQVQFEPHHWEQFSLHLRQSYDDALGAGTTTVNTLPGVFELLSALAQLDDFRRGVVTGNLEAGARIKLQAARLDSFLGCGAYASDSAHRPDLPKIARERWEKLTGESFSPGHCVIVGDTAKDLDAARHNGMRCLLVGTGRYPVEELAYSNPDGCVADLTETTKIIEMLRTI